MLLRHRTTCRVKIKSALWRTVVIAIRHDCQDDRLHYLFRVAA